MPGIAKQPFSKPPDLIPEELFWPEIVSRISLTGDPRGGPKNHRILKKRYVYNTFCDLYENANPQNPEPKTLGKQAPFARAAKKTPRAKKPLFRLCF